jgi:hypothetical protein
LSILAFKYWGSSLNWQGSSIYDNDLNECLFVYGYISFSRFCSAKGGSCTAPRVTRCSTVSR